MAPDKDLPGPETEFNRVAVIGVGLIGGSLGLAVKKYCRSVHVLGIDRPEVIRTALRRGAIDDGAGVDELGENLTDRDLIFLATPVSAIPELLERIKNHARPGAIITDTSSTKAAVMEAAASSLPPEVYFIGGHPMAGSERRGIEAADPFLFENAVYVLCRPESTPQERFDFLAALLVRIGARVKPLDAGLHDRIAAYTSHLPQLVAVTLVNILGRSETEDEDFFSLAAGGFRSLTRIADSPVDIWADIFRTNKESITEVVRQFREELDRMTANLDRSELADFFDSSRNYRRRLPKDTRGFLNPLYDLTVEVQDRPGILASITTSLFEAGLNIKDIEVLKIREGTSGVLRLGFEDGDARENGRTVLRELGYRCWAQE